jgi:hypothetical protein
MLRKCGCEISVPTPGLPCSSASFGASHPTPGFKVRVIAACLFVLASFLPVHADHVHELYYNNANWIDTDLTALTGGAIATSFGAITAFYTTPNQQLHVYYVDMKAQHVHQLYYNNTSWSDADLTSATGGPAASPFGISGFSIGNLQYVFYTGTDNHVHELNYNNSNWSDHDITAQGSGVGAGFGPILAFATKPNNQFHVYYQDANTLDLHQLYFNGSSWSDADLTSITGAACYTSWIAGLAAGNQQHIFCPGIHGSLQFPHMLHIYYNNSTWVYEDITSKVGGAQLYLGSGVAAFQVPGKAQGEVFGVTGDAHVHQYSFNKKWTDLDLTASIGAPASAAFGGMVAFATTPNNQFHAFYQPSTEVYQLYFNGSSWAFEDLTGGGGQADDNSGMAGFAIGNLQHVYYLSAGN